MKSTGIVRKVDELGRVVLPIELRRTFNIKEGDPVEVYTQDDAIVLKKFENRLACVVTGEVSNENAILLNGKIAVSKEGAEKLIKLLEGVAK